MKTNIISFVIFFSIIFFGCEKNPDNPLPGDPVNIELTTVQKSLVQSDNNFGFDIFKLIVENETEAENIMISPLSISYALSMTLNGANTATRDSMMAALRYYNMNLDDINNSYKDLTEKLMTVDERVLMEIANSVWIEDRLSVKQDFIDALRNYFDAETRNFSVSDPEIKDVINKWIEDHTNGLIKEMISEIPPDIAMLLINAIYFNGKWRYQFDKNETEEKPFYPENGSVVDVEMMAIETSYKAFSGEDFVLVELPYGQGNFVMDVLLPNEGNNAVDMLAEINPDNWNNAISGLYEREIQLYMPRFKYGYKKEIKDLLSDMGMGIAFSGEADFSNISDQDLFISKVLHQTFIENDEEGTEAAAATVVMMEFTSAPSGPYIVNLNRPFIYIIRETSTNTIVFMGLTGNPAIN